MPASEDKQVTSANLQKSKQLSYDIKQLHANLIQKEEMPRHILKDGLNTAGVFTSEIGFPFITAITGMATFLEQHIPTLDVNHRIELSTAISAADSSVHVILLFSVYASSVGVSYFSKRNNEDNIHQLILLKKATQLFNNLSEEEKNNFRSEFDRHFNSITTTADIDSRNCLTQAGIFCITGLLFIAFAGLRISGGAFLLLNLFMITGITVSPIIAILMWGIISLYTLSGLLTRYSSINNLFDPFSAKDLKKLKDDYPKPAISLTQIEQPTLENFYDRISLTFVDINAHSENLWQKAYLYGVITSEILIPFVGDLVGMCNLFGSFKIGIILLSLFITMLNTAVNSALLIPVFKKSLGFTSDLDTNEIEETKKQLKEFDELLNDLSKKTFRLEDIHNINTYYEALIAKEALYATNKAALSNLFLLVFVSTRVANGHFILTSFAGVLSHYTFAAALISNPLFIAAFVTLYAAYGFATRKEAIRGWMNPLPQSKFTEVKHKYAQLFQAPSSAEATPTNNISTPAQKSGYDWSCGTFNYLKTNIPFFGSKSQAPTVQIPIKLSLSPTG